MSDPNGWITNPPSTFVVVQNTTRDELNGQFGLVLQFHQDRYIVALTKMPRQEPKSFKAEHLRKTGHVEQLRAQYEILMNDPTMQQQLQRVLQQIQQATGLRLQYLAGIVMAVVLASAWFLGVRKTLLLLSSLLLLGLLVGPAYLETKSIKAAVRKAPERFKKMLCESNLPFAAKIASSNLYVGLVVGLLMAFFVSGMLPQSASSAATAASPFSPVSSWFSSAGSSTTTASSLSAVDMERYYKLGFEDATEQKTFGASLPEPTAAAAAAKPSGPHRDLGADDYGDYSNSHSYSAYDTMPTKSKTASSLFSMTNVICVMTILRTLNECGRDPSTGQVLNAQRVWANLQGLPVWRLGMLGMSVYRLGSAVMTTF